MNQINITGNLTKEVELRYTQQGTAVARFSIAVKRNYAKDGQKDTDFFNVVVFGKKRRMQLTT